MSIIYGLDDEQPVTTTQVRDAIVLCFYEAHCMDTGLDSGDEKTAKKYCESLVKNAFETVHANFEAPTKQDILHVIDQLAQFSSSFRDPAIIRDHAKTIQALADKISV